MKSWIACALAVLAVSTAAAQDRRVSPVEARRMALVIGNNAYPWKPLVNSVNDARSMAALLPKVGFDPRDVTLVTDASLRDLQRAGREFIQRLRPGDVAFVFYSGHGVEMRGENFLIPVDFPSNATELEVQDEAWSAQQFLRNLEASPAKVRILILDACRDNPLRATRSGAGGLARMDGQGTLIVFATGAGSTADDNPRGGNGLFTSRLLRAMPTPGVPVDQMIKQVARDVYRDSNERQTPAVYGLLLEDFVFVNGPAPSGVPAPRVDAAAESWALIKDSRDPADFDSFAKTFPDSALAKSAQLRADQLRRVPAAPSTLPSVVATQPKPAAGMGDLGVTAVGERSLQEFKLKKQLSMQTVGDISLRLQATFPATQKFTLSILADDKLIQKTSRHLNEALQFYVGKSLYEIVVTSVETDLVTGYVSRPRVPAAETVVPGPKTDVAGSGLARVPGDLGGTSPLIATNKREIEALRQRRDLDIVEFTLNKQKNLQKVADIALRLEKADDRKDMFTLIIQADDKTSERKDRHINEPLQFYVSTALYEIVVNSVGKDQIQGYLSKRKYSPR